MLTLGRKEAEVPSSIHLAEALVGTPEQWVAYH